MGTKPHGERKAGHKEVKETSNAKKKTRILTYALPEGSSHLIGVDKRDKGDFELHVASAGSGVSFLDYDGVVLFAGAFEDWLHPDDNMGPYARCTSDLDRREREIHTLLQDKVPVIFLVPPIKRFFRHDLLPSHTDLFRRVLDREGIHWEDLDKQRIPFLPSVVSEFRSFMERYGTGSVAFVVERSRPPITMIAGIPKYPLAFERKRKLFCLPCYAPANQHQAIEIATEAARAVLTYHARLSMQLPAWIKDYRFAKEEPLREKIIAQQETLAASQSHLQRYANWKGALCYQSTPLEEVITDILKTVFGLNVVADGGNREDAVILDKDDSPCCLVEIKGIAGNFGQNEVDQVRNHRRRAGLESLAGVLILNTKRKAASLDEKDLAPNEEIIQKACEENVLLIRTLDLLRFADLIDQGKKTQDDFREIILNQSGWLCVEGDDVSIRTE